MDKKRMDDKKMKILAFTRYGRLGASSRVRFFQFENVLRSSGCQLYYHALLSDKYLEILYSDNRQSLLEISKGYICRCINLFRIPFYDVIWIEKEIFPGLPALIERILNLCGVKVVVDYDDAVFHNYDLSRNLYYRLFLSNKISVVMRTATTVVAGNAYIAEYATLNRVKDIRIIPSVVDSDKYSVRLREPNLLPVIGWIGTPSTLRYLREIVPVLRRIIDDVPFEFVVVGALLEIPEMQVRCVPWSEKTEIELIQQFDIGIMPLPDEPWARGKCGYKLIQYMACGLAVVGSPVGVNSKIIGDGNGILADSLDAWELNLMLLLRDSELRKSLGVKARSQVEKFYSLRSVESAYLSQFHI